MYGFDHDLHQDVTPTNNVEKTLDQKVNCLLRPPLDLYDSPKTSFDRINVSHH